MARRRGPVAVLAALLLALAAGNAACGPEVDLSQALEVTEVFSGYYDDGIKNGSNHLLPSITFRLHNRTASSIRSVELMLGFWAEGADGELDNVLTHGIAGSALPGGASTDQITVRTTVGYAQEGPRAELFNHRLFRDVTAKMFAKHGGKLYRLGEFKVERRLIPHASSGRP